MSDALTALVVSTAALLLLVLLFRAEHARGRRFFDEPRSHLDFWFLKIRHIFNVRLRNWCRLFLRQMGHYFIHTILMGAIAGLSNMEERLRTVARSNRALAKKSDRERSESNKLDEVALHKMEVALSDEEKRIRRHTSLEG